MLKWVKRNPNKCMGLAWPLYVWAKAWVHTRLGYDFLPATDILVTSILTMFGAAAIAKPNPPTQ